jgi:hypothetical protein
MIVVRFNHGLGNQLFQYSAGRALAARSGLPLFLDKSWYAWGDRPFNLHKLRVKGKTLPVTIGRLLNGTPRDPSDKRLRHHIPRILARQIIDRQQGFEDLLHFVSRFRPTYLSGFWQSERYFAELRPTLLNELKPVDALSDGARHVINEIEQNDAIAIHIRRGDLLSNPLYNATIGTLTAAYYREALARLLPRVPRAKAYIFSDDVEWAAANVPKHCPMTIVTGTITRTEMEDLAVMSRCKHFIIANSTFSWWGAWLSDRPGKSVIAPSRFFRIPQPWEKDMVPDTWERIDADLEAK